MEDHPEIGLLGPIIIGSDGKVQRSCMGYPSLWNTFCRALALDSMFPQSRLFGSHLLTYSGHNETRPVEVINGCFWVVRRSAMEQVGLLDERFFIYGEDVDWCKRFNDGGWKVVFFSDAEALHYGGASSANAPIRFDIEMQRASYQYWTKHHSRVEAVTYLMISLLHHLLRIIGELAVYPLRRSRPASTYKIKRGMASIRWIVGPTERAS
jgi:GT2 family glycosyltransferase